jgi:hypothetical protein
MLALGCGSSEPVTQAPPQVSPQPGTVTTEPSESAIPRLPGSSVARPVQDCVDAWNESAGTDQRAMVARLGYVIAFASPADPRLPGAGQTLCTILFHDLESWVSYTGRRLEGGAVEFEAEAAKSRAWREGRELEVDDNALVQPDGSLRAAAGPGRVVERLPESDGNLTFYVHVQGRIDPHLITVAIDGRLAVAGEFTREGERSRVEYRFDVADGGHVLSAAAGDGTSLVQAFEVDGATWAALGYWGQPQLASEPFFDLAVSNQEFGFA